MNRLTDEIYDANHKQIDFDYKEFIRIVYRIKNKDPKSDDLKKMIERGNFKKIPNGVYYCSYINKENELTPCLLFENYNIWMLSKIRFACGEISPEDSFSYFYASLPVVDFHIYVVFSKTLYAIGKDMDLATRNLKLKIFDRYRSRILNMEKRGRKR